MSASLSHVPSTRHYPGHVDHLYDETVEVLGRAGYDRLLIHSGRPRARFQDDYVPPFRAHPHFVAWLPLPRHADCLLEIRPGHRPKLWLVLPDDFWHAPPAAPEDWWAERFDIEIVQDASAWADVLKESSATALIAEPGDFPDLGGGADVNPEPVVRALDEIRTAKTDWQIDCIRQANRIAVKGHGAAREAFLAGASELEIHLAYLKAAAHEPDALPYNSIVALNEHGAVLHYQYRDRKAPAESRSFLIDAGADCFGYAADITRTWCRDGDSVFNGLIEQMDALQQRIVGRMQAGLHYVDLHLDTHRGVAEILRESGICRMSLDAMLEANVTGRFLPHGLGHFLGVQVHDVAGRIGPDGTPQPPPDQHRALRLTRELRLGNVVTVEPGLYFIPSLLDPLRESTLRDQIDWALVDALIPYGGIRIEDDVAVTRSGPVNLTREAFLEAQI